MDPATLRLSGCTVDLGTGRVDPGPHVLTPNELELLAFFAAHPGEDLGRGLLLERVWGYRPTMNTRTVDMTIRRLRTQIERDAARPVHLLTAPGAGYRFEPDDAPVRHAEDLPRPPVSEAPRARTNILPDAPSLHGRAGDLEILEQALATERLVTLIGPGGAGKTRLAREFGLRRDEAWFCDLTQAVTTEGICAVVAQVLGASTNTKDPVEQVAHALAGRGRPLLILDNLEQVVAVAAQVVARWIALSPTTTFLATSREPLRIAGERVLHVAPLGVEPAVALFLERARHLRPGLQPSEAVAELVRRLDGLPLAIELAAARSNLLTPEAMLERIEQRFTLLAGGRRDVPTRHDTLWSTIAWSWDLLGPGEQDALAQCAVFRGGFDLDAAEGVLELRGDLPILDTLEALLARSLLVDTTTPDGEVRLGMLESIHAFARQALDASGRATEVEARHGAWFGGRGDATLDRPMQGLGPTFRRELLETENFLAATERAVARGDRDAAGACGATACWLLYCSGGLRAIPRIADPVLALTGVATRHRRRLLWQVARATSRLGDRGRAFACCEELLALARAADDPLDFARATLLAACVRSPAASAEPLFLDALAQARALGARAVEGEALTYLGLLHKNNSRVEEARACYEQALVVHQETGDLEHQTITLGNLANVQFLAGDLLGALQTMDALDVLVDRLGARDMLITNTVNRARTLKKLGRLDEAEAAFRHGLGLLRASPGRGVEGLVLSHLADIELKRDRIDAAEALAVEAVTEARAGGNELTITQALLTRGDIHLCRGRPDDAARALAEARAVAAAVGADSHPLLSKLMAELEARIAEYAASRT